MKKITLIVIQVFMTSVSSSLHYIKNSKKKPVSYIIFSGSTQEAIGYIG